MRVDRKRRRLATVAAAAAALAASAMTLVAAQTADAAEGCAVDYNVVNDWGSGFQANVSITAGEALDGWTVEWDFTGAVSGISAWNVTDQSLSGSHFTASDSGWNGSIASGQTKEVFGFTASGTAGDIENVSVNGVSCGGEDDTDPTDPDPTSPDPTDPTDDPTDDPDNQAPDGSPVAEHGQLHVCGTHMCDEQGDQMRLRGVSSMWLHWQTQPYAQNLSALEWMRDNWNIDVFRVAMGVEPEGAYLDNPGLWRSEVEKVIDNAATAGVYVIVDFHAHEAHQHQSEAVEFFSYMAERYGDLPNVIWEPYNEPTQVSWSGTVKPYHEAVISAIRAEDPDNIVVLGSPNWSQDVDVAASNPVSGTNLMYTLHFYSCTHKDWLRDKADTAINAGLALFVTEWGASDADGGLDGQVCLDEAQRWIDWMSARGISWTAWKLDVGDDSTNLLSAGAPVTGGWDNYLHGHAPFVIANLP
ncbi:cellulase family glycosylhydrolase [Glycomyces arizonensis]|uniref:cellulase family glycosylhydrolase n=1 Tax=Glycomyces arizonensis TaxID=256035 RepID=UPI0003FF83BA|nr:cellulase family glycosylhydrolase [Glycomyces arizonensis]